MKSYNTVDNAYSDTVSQIAFPSSFTTSSDMLAYNAALAKLVTALDGARQRFAGLQPSSLEPNTATHLQRTLAYLDNFKQVLAALQQALSQGDQTGIQQHAAETQKVGIEESAINRSTEALMLKYNITDVEVLYLYRGK